MTILPSMLSRTAYVVANRKTRKDFTHDREVTLVGAHVGGLFRNKVYFTVMFQWNVSSNKVLYVYPAEWIYFPPQPTPATS